MRIFRRNQPKDVLFLMPIRHADEKLSKGKIRMLYCDTDGKVYSSIMSRSVYDLALDIANNMELNRKSYATIGLEIGPGKFIPTAIEIDHKELWALEHILDHALKSGKVPDILKKYIKPMIQLDEASRQEVISEYRKRRREERPEPTPRVLERLSYYSETEIEFSMPLYKARHSYPLIVLRRLQSNESIPNNVARLLIMDSDGDLAIIKVSSKLMFDVEKGLKKYRAQNNRNVCVILSQGPEGLSTDYMVISQLQKKALDTVARYFEETGNGKRPISTAARTVLIRARDRISTPVA